MVTISIFATFFAGCTASFGTGDNTSAAAKPANAASNSAANKPANTTSTTAAKTDKPKAALTNEKKPEGKAKTVKNTPVPADWIYVYDENKGYGFSVPEGTTGETGNTDGVDFMGATTPQNIDMFVLAYKNKELTKEDLLTDTVTVFGIYGTESYARKIESGKR